MTKEFKELFGELTGLSKSAFEDYVVDPQEDNQQWKALCAFCQNEVKKANDELTQILNPTQALDKPGLLKLE